MRKIAAQYEKVITTYHVTRLDLDTEEDSLNNYAGINRRNEAIALVERWAARTHRTVQFVYTLPTNTTSLDQGGNAVLQNAVANGARIAIVDIMTFDYYDNLPHEMADNTEGAGAVDTLGRVVTWNGRWWSSPRPVDPQGAGLDSVSCPQRSFCVAVDGWKCDHLERQHMVTLGPRRQHRNRHPVRVLRVGHVLCRRRLGRRRHDLRRDDLVRVLRRTGLGRRPGDLQRSRVDARDGPATSCMAVDWDGNALHWNGTSWPATAVSCNGTSTYTAGTCTTTGTYADPRTGVLDSVSCPTASFCAARCRACPARRRRSAWRLTATATR
ncbi:MAG: hypothetical protein ACRDN0_07245 [Trebonia sp.]